MEKLININTYPINKVLKILLMDKTTEKNIIWATDTYTTNGKYKDTDTIETVDLLGFDSLILQPRITKSLEEQQQRTRKKAEVFTPVWLCNQMNNYCDEQWFGRKDVFNFEREDHTWKIVKDKIEFPKGKNWKKYVDSRRLEITCGEAPFIVSRYDMATGDLIHPPRRRIGILDRKMRIVNENASDEEWLKWAIRAVQACYGYEYQGDNLLIARINMVLTFRDYYLSHFEEEPDLKLIKKVATIISWNFWQMDGLKDTAPRGGMNDTNHQLSIFEMFESDDDQGNREDISCKIFNWRSNESLLYKDIKGDATMSKKLFDFCIGNPPYQSGDNESNARQSPIYPLFYDAAKSLANKYMLISPARFLFNAGLTSKIWNQIMLNDEHIKVEYYNQTASEIFPNTDIKGGVAILYRDNDMSFGAIEEFIPDDNWRSLIQKIKKSKYKSLTSIMHGGRSDLKFNDEFLKAYPTAIQDRLKAIQKKNANVTTLGPNEEYELKSSAFDILGYAFCEDVEDKKSYYRILGLSNNKRVWRWIKRNYMTPRDKNNNNIEKYKVLISKASGTGKFGEALSEPIVSGPGESSTPTFISIGQFSTKQEAENASKYIKTKFARALLSILKITQDNVPSKWKYVPMQNFSDNSDIDWSKSVNEIDVQLYRKYAFSSEDILYIESNAKEMN